MTIAEQLKQTGKKEAAAEYQRQIEAMAKREEQALREKEALLKQLREAGIKPRTSNH